MEKSFLEYDKGYREGTFDKCNGNEAEYERDESDPFVCGYFDAYDNYKVVIEKPLATIVMEADKPLIPLYFVDTGDDLIEGVFDKEGNLLGCWSPNDATWRSEYFEPFMEALGFDCRYGNGELDTRLRRHAMELWGLTEEEVGLID